MPRSMAAAHLWVRTVVENVGDREHLPRTKPSSWCESFCAWFSDCRGGFVVPDEEITDDQIAAAVITAHHTKRAKTEATEQHAAAMAVLEGVDSGRVGEFRIVTNHVEPTATRSGYTRKEVRLCP